jgi:hypothetical protein
MWIIDISPRDIDAKVLSACQKDAREGVYATAMAGAIQWFARDGRISKVRSGFRGEIESHRADAIKALSRMQLAGDDLRRTTDNTLNLMLGFQHFLEFAVRSKALPEDEASDLLDACREALVVSAQRQAKHQREEDPVARFFQLIKSALLSGLAFISAADGSEPGEALNLLCGYRRRVTCADRLLHRCMPVPGHRDELPHRQRRRRPQRRRNRRELAGGAGQAPGGEGDVADRRRRQARPAQRSTTHRRRDPIGLESAVRCPRHPRGERGGGISRAHRRNRPLFRAGRTGNVRILSGKGGIVTGRRPAKRCARASFARAQTRFAVRAPKSRAHSTCFDAAPWFRGTYKNNAGEKRCARAKHPPGSPAGKSPFSDA